MDELHEVLDKFFTEVDHLDNILDHDDPDEVRVALALSVAKRVRTDSTLVVRALARLRDQLQPSGGTS